MAFKRMEEHDLYGASAVSARGEYEANKHKGVVEVSVIVNAYSAAFYAGARLVETPRHKQHWLPKWWPGKKGNYPLHIYYDRKMPDLACDQYIKKHYLACSPKDEKIIRDTFIKGFWMGGEFRWKLG